MKGDTSVAVDAIDMAFIQEMADYEKLPKKSVVSNAVRFYWNYWQDGDVHAK